MNPAAILTLISSLMEQLLALETKVGELEAKAAKGKRNG
jgi:hypothetical protein